MKVTSLKFLKSVLLSMLFMLFAVQVNAQLYGPSSGPGSDGPNLQNGSETVCQLNQMTEYQFRESNSSGLGSRFRFRIDTGSIIADPTGATLRKLTKGTHYNYNNGSSASVTGWEQGVGLNLPTVLNEKIQITWLKPGTYTLYASRYTDVFSYDGSTSNQDRWTAFVITVGAGVPPVMDFSAIAPDTICSGETVIISLYANPQGNPPTGYRFHMVDNSSVIGFPQDTVIDAQMISGNNALTLDRLVNTSDISEKIEIHITPLGGSPVGTTCDGENDTLYLFIHPQVINPDVNTTLCKGTSINIADLIDSVKNAKTIYTYAFFSDIAGTIPVTSLLINNLLEDTIFYVQATDPRFTCGTNKLATIAIETEYQAALPTFNKDTNVCMGSTKDLAFLIDSVGSNGYNFFGDDMVTPVVDPTNVGPFTTTDDVTYYVQTVEANGCLSELVPIVIHPILIPAITVTPINGTPYGTGNLLVYKEGIDPEFEIERIDGGLTTAWTYTLNNEVVNATTNPVVHTFTGLANDTVFNLTRITSEGCYKDTTVSYSLRILPTLEVTASATNCNNPDSVVTNGGTATICEGDNLYLCVLPNQNNINPDEKWGISYTDISKNIIVTTVNTTYNVPYTMIKTDTMRPGVYNYTIDTLVLTGSMFPIPIKDNEVNFSYTINILPVLSELLDFDSVVNTTAIICEPLEFEIGTKANCNIGELAKVMIVMDTEGLLVEYEEAGQWITLNSAFVNDTCFWGPPTGFPVQDLVEGNGSKFRISSTSLVDIPNVNYEFVLVNATNPNEAWSNAISGSFEVRKLPRLPIIDPTNGKECINLATIEYSTEEGMDIYNWTITPSANGTDYKYTKDDTTIFEVEWLVPGEYTISLSYADTNGCEWTTDSIVNIYPVPSADLVLETYPDTLFCPDYDIPFHITNFNGITADFYGDYRIYTVIRVHGNGEDLTLNHYFIDQNPNDIKFYLHLGNENFLAGNYTVTIDTLIDLLQPIACPGKGNNEVEISLFTAPTASIIGSEPDPICSNVDFDVLVDIVGGHTAWTLYYSAAGVNYNESFTNLTDAKVPLVGAPAPSVLVSLDSIASPFCPAVALIDVDSLFEIKPLPVPAITIVDMLTDTVCKMASVVFATEENMTNYQWSISGGTSTDYTYTRNDTSSFDVQWFTAGDYTVSIVYTDANGCTNTLSTDTTITVIEIPSAILTFAQGQEKHNCPDNNNVNLVLTANNVMTNGPWRVVYSAVDYNNNVVKTYTEETVSANSGIAQLTADRLPAGKYTFRVDTLLELNSVVQCPGVANPNTTDTIFIYPEITLLDVYPEPDIVCESEKAFHIVIEPDSSLYTEKNIAIPHYSGYKAWVTAPNGIEYPLDEFLWVNANINKVFIPDSVLEPGLQKFVISRVQTTIDNQTIFCSITNLDSTIVDVLPLPVVEIVGQDTVCETILSDATYKYETSIELKEYNWSVATITGGGTATILSNSTDSVVDIIFDVEGDYQIYLAAKNETCENFDTLNIHVAPHPELIDINDALANLHYVNCETQEFEIGTDANCRKGEMAQVAITMDTTGLIIEYFETDPSVNDWLPLNSAFVNGVCLFGPATGFPVQDFITQGSKFRIISRSAVRDVRTYNFVLVDAANPSVIWSDSIKGSFILTPTAVEAELVEFALNNAIVNCEQQIFPLAITPNCQEGNPVQVRIELEETADADDFIIEYDSIGKWVALDYPFVAMIDSLTGETDTVLFRLVSDNQNLARDINYTVYLDNEDGTIVWDTIENQMFRLAKNTPVEFAIIESPIGDSVVCFDREIKIAFEPNCLLSDTNMGKMVIGTNVDISALAEVSYEGMKLDFQPTGNGAYQRGFVATWPGVFNKYADTVTLVINSINQQIVDEMVRFYFRIVDTATTFKTTKEIIDPNTGTVLPILDTLLKIKGRPVTPIFIPDTIGLCQANKWINFPEAANQPPHSVYVWTDSDNNIVTNTHIGDYGVQDFSVQYFDTNTGCYSDDALFVIEVSSDPNVLRMTSFVYCKDDITEPFVFHDYFTENSPNVEYEYRGIGDPTWFINNGFPYNGFDTIPSFVAYNSTTVPLILTYEVIATDVNDTCNSGRNRKEFTVTINPQPRIPIVVTDMVYCNGTSVAIQNSPFPTNDAQYIYEWRRIDGDTIFVNQPDNGNGAFAFTTVNNTDSVLSATYTVKPRFANYNETCGVDTANFTISILPTPIVDAVNYLSYCANDTVSAIVFGGKGATSYNWVKLGGGANVGADVYGMSGKDSIPSFVALNNNTTTATAIYRVTPVYELGVTICEGATMDFAIEVLPKPIVYPIANQEICSGAKTEAIAFGGNATWVWENVTSNITGSLPTTYRFGTGIAEYTLINTTDILQTVKIAVVPSNGTCEGDTVRFEIDVYPQPKVDVIADQIICSQSQTTKVIFAGTAESYTWRNIGSPIMGLPASGTDSLGTYTLTNLTSSPITATIEVTPITNDGVCVGTAKTFSITVNPEPTLTNLPADYVLCSGARTVGATFTGSASSFTWVATAPSTTTGFPTGIQAGSFGTYTLTNSGSNVDTVKVTVTPKSGICVGIPQTFKILVNPVPSVNTISNYNICSGAQLPTITFGGAGTFNWTVTGDQIVGLPSSGVGNITARTLTNATNLPLTAVVTVEPSSGGCTGASTSFSITVNPNPSLTNKPINATICSGDVYPAVTFTGIATTFDWSVTSTGVTGFTSTSGSNVFGPFTLANTGTSAATATVSVTSRYINGTTTCSSPAEIFTITVSPEPTLTVTPSDVVICHDASVNYNFGANAEWTASGDLITGLPVSGTGTLSAKLENRGTTALITVITVTPKSSTCIGTSHQFTITVNPEPVINNVPADYTICNNSQTTPFTFTGVATKYEWSVSSNSNIIGFPSGTQTGNFGTYMLTNNTATPQTVTVTVIPYYNHGGTTCPGASASFDITVNPSAEITNTLNDIALCDGQSTGTINFAGATHYEWVVTGDRISGLPTGVQTGNFGPYTVSNMGTVALNATVTVTPRYIDEVNCAGTPVSFDIVVNPSTVVTSAGIVANKTNFCIGETMLLSIEATGANLTYQWYKDGSMIATATSEQYEVAEIELSTAGDYYVVVEGACGKITSEIVTITVGNGDMLLEKWHDIIHVDNYAQLYTGYQWYKDGKKLEGATKQFYHESGGLKGCYYVVLTLASGGTETSCEKCYDNTKLATKDWKLSVYPNPSKQGNKATGILFSDNDVKYDGSLNVTIHNMNGAEVLRMNKVGGQFDMETIQLAPGVYNVRVVTEEGKIYNEKMIVY